MRDVMGMMKQIQGLQKRMTDMQAELETMTVEGQSGGGLVKATLTAKGALQRLSIDPSLVKEGEAEMVEDLVVAACADARGKAERLMEEKMREVTGGLPIPPGLKLF